MSASPINRIELITEHMFMTEAQSSLTLMLNIYWEMACGVGNIGATRESAYTLGLQSWRSWLLYFVKLGKLVKFLSFTLLNSEVIVS